MEMGFDEKEVIDALRVNNNQQEAAVCKDSDSWVISTMSAKTKWAQWYSVKCVVKSWFCLVKQHLSRSHFYSISLCISVYHSHSVNGCLVTESPPLRIWTRALIPTVPCFRPSWRTQLYSLVSQTPRLFWVSFSPLYTQGFFKAFAPALSNLLYFATFLSKNDQNMLFQGFQVFTWF